MAKTQTINNKANRKNNSQIEKFEKKKSMVDSTGFQSQETKIKQLLQAGINLNIAKQEMRYDTMEDNDIDIQAPPFRGLQPDLAEMSELKRENAIRIHELKKRHQIKREATKADQQKIKAEQQKVRESIKTDEKSEKDESQNEPEGE